MQPTELNTNLLSTISVRVKQFLKVRTNILLILLVLFHVFINVFWHRINTAPPTWDSAGHLTLSFIFADRYLPLLSGQFSLVDFLKISSYYPPFVHLLGGLMIWVFGRNYEITILLGTGFLVLGMVYLYAVMKRLFPNDERLPILTVFIFSFFPGVWEQARQFHLDVPVTALLIASYYHMLSSDSFKLTKHTLLFFMYFVFIQLTKWYGFVYLVIPFVAHVLLPAIRAKDYFDKKRLVNIVIGSVMVLVFALPWYVINLQSIEANVLVASTADAGDPVQVFSYESIFHYLKLMTSHQIGFVSVLLLFVGLYWAFKRKEWFSKPVYWMILVPYAVFTIIQNKDLRYVLPLAPIVAFAISYVLLKGSEKTSFLKSAVYAMYLVFMFFFMSFNQYQKLPKSLEFIGTAYAGPAYGGAWIYEPWAYSYNGKSWRGEEIIKKVSELAASEPSIQGGYKVLEVADNRFYSLASFDMYKMQNRLNNMQLVVPYYRFDPLTPAELDEYLSELSYALIPVDAGPPGLRNIAVLNQLIKYFGTDANKDFTLVEQFELPDGNRIDLYKRTNMLGLINSGKAANSLKVYSSGDMLLLDRSALGDVEVPIRAFDSNGVVTNLLFARGGGEQKRISLTGFSKFIIDYDLDHQSIIDLRGWIYNGGEYLRDQSYDQLVLNSGNTFKYQNFSIKHSTQFSNNIVSSVEVKYDPASIKISLVNPAETAFIAYATTGWVWNNVELNVSNRDIVIPTAGLIQLNVSQKNTSFEGVPSDVGYFPCYNGDAVCFYPLVEGL